MGQLSVPRFMVEGDTANLIGKVLNYSPDTIDVNTRFTVDGRTNSLENRRCADALIDTLEVVAGSDSITAEYMVSDPKGFSDGEKRSIPVFKRGLEMAVGDFFALDTDTSVVLKGLPGYGKITLHAQADALDVVETEIDQLHRYRYLCNEQLASKLKALLAAQTIAKYKNGKDKYDGHIDRCIKLLLKNQNTNGSWGWWPSMDGNNYITRHVLEALIGAKNMGFKVDLKTASLAETLIFGLENSISSREDLIIVLLLKILDAPINYQRYITKFEKMGQYNLDETLSLIELKQKCSIPININILNPYRRTTLWGNVYFADTWSYGHWWAGDVQNTLKAYTIFKADTADHSLLLRKMRNFFFEKRRSGCWTNTYESARIIETILPDLLVKGEKEMKAQLVLTGATNQTITQFPFHTELTTDQELKVTKTGALPVYLSASQHYWEPNPKERKGNFVITTYFKNDVKSKLTAGKPVTLVAKVEVRKKAEFVMVNIPIPGGCSYESKPQPWGVECHREYYRHETAIFCEHLGIGTHYFEVKLLPRYSGKYTLNPAKIELMYFPTFNANNELKKVDIR
jgi:alpha-2-macroglobulin